MMRLVYVWGLKGLAPEKWGPDTLSGHMPDVIHQIPLQPDECNLPLNELVRRYPPPKISRD